MLSSFLKREKAFEEKFTHSQEIEFKIQSYRNILLAEWAGQEMGLDVPTLKSYVQEIQSFWIKNPDIQQLNEKIGKNFKKHKVSYTSHQIEIKLYHFYEEAKLHLVR